MTPSTPPPPDRLPPRSRPPFAEPLAKAAEEIETLRRDNRELRAIVRRTLDADGGAPVISTSRMFQLLFSALSPSERRTLLGEIGARYCMRCGDDDGGCPCA